MTSKTELKEEVAKLYSGLLNLQRKIAELYKRLEETQKKIRELPDEKDA